MNLFLQGICPAHQNCSLSWNKMADVLTDLQTYPQLYEIVTPDEIKTLFKAINDGKIYIKTVFRHEIEMSSNIKIKRSIIYYSSALTWQCFDVAVL